jgi:hypothetical protein
MNENAHKILESAGTVAELIMVNIKTNFLAAIEEDGFTKKKLVESQGFSVQWLDEILKAKSITLRSLCALAYLSGSTPIELMQPVERAE